MPFNRTVPQDISYFKEVLKPFCVVRLSEQHCQRCEDIYL